MKMAWAPLLLALGACDGRPDCDLPTENVRFVQLATDGHAVMALRSDGRAACWGNDFRGVCGQTTAAKFTVPFFSEAVSCATSVQLDSAGSAIGDHNQLLVWGSEDTVQFADGNVAGATAGWTQRVTLPAIRQASVRGSALALTTNGTVYYWGIRDLTDGTEEVISVPSPLVMPFDGPAAYVDSFTNDCVLDQEGNAYCRGPNDDGQIGDGTFEARDQFVRVALPEPALTIATGFDSSCAVLKSRRVACWGNDIYAQNSTVNEPVPVVVAGVAGVDAVRVSNDDIGGACAFARGGPMACWGYPMIQQIPDADGYPRLFPVFDILDVAFGSDGRGCVIRASDGWVYCSGELTGNAEEYDPENKMNPIPAPRELELE